MYKITPLAIEMPTHQELERLAILNEECSEVSKNISKIIRHGFDAHNPLIPNSETNREKLEKEIGDVLTAIELLYETGSISQEKVLARKKEKMIQVRDWMHFPIADKGEVK